MVHEVRGKKRNLEWCQAKSVARLYYSSCMSGGVIGLNYRLQGHTVTLDQRSSSWEDRFQEGQLSLIEDIIKLVCYSTQSFRKDN